MKFICLLYKDKEDVYYIDLYDKDLKIVKEDYNRILMDSGEYSFFNDDIERLRGFRDRILFVLLSNRYNEFLVLNINNNVNGKLEVLTEKEITSFVKLGYDIDGILSLDLVENRLKKDRIVFDLYFPQELIERIKIERFSGNNKVLGYKDKIVLIDCICSPYKAYDSSICDMYYLRCQYYDSLYHYTNKNSMVEKLYTNKDNVILQYDTKNNIFIYVKNDNVCKLMEVSIEEIILNKNKYKCKLRFDEDSARIAHNLMPMRDYHVGSKTVEYRKYIDNAYDIVERIEKEIPKYAEKARMIAER